MPMRGELPTVATRPYPHASYLEIAWFHCRAIVSDRDLQCVAGFCAIGLLLAVNIMLRLPELGATAAMLQTIP